MGGDDAGLPVRGGGSSFWRSGYGSVGVGEAGEAFVEKVQNDEQGSGSNRDSFQAVESGHDTEQSGDSCGSDHGRADLKADGVAGDIGA